LEDRNPASEPPVETRKLEITGFDLLAAQINSFNVFILE
jgi:hypothetical protein